jgi:hypothetical protein
MYLEKYEKDLCDEIKGAKKYALWGIELKEDYPEYARKLKEMASQELTHYEMLDTIAERMTDNETEKMIYNHMHKMHLEEIAEVKYIISLI